MNKIRVGEGLPLTGLDGSNPLAFLAALGTLRTLSLAWPGRDVKMSWTQHSGAWRPVIHTVADLDANLLIDEILARLCPRGNTVGQHPHLELGKNLSVSPSNFRKHARRSARAARLNDHRWADFVASFGSEALQHPNPKIDRIAYTQFCFLFGSGHQHYLATMGKLLENVTDRHLREALFGPWQYKDTRLSMRWDPVDRREHAYQWTSPGDETVTSVWGANLLAVEGVALYPTISTSSGNPTAGFRRKRRQTEFTWPVWHSPISSDAVRSLIAAPVLAMDQPAPQTLREVGVVAVFRAGKVKIGEGTNYKWSFSEAEAV